MSYKLLFGGALALMLGGTSASAATFGFTEGLRDLVAGTTALTPTDGPNTPAGFDLTAGGALVAGESGALHGRIVSQADLYEFTSNVPFEIRFDFDGYDLDAGGSVGVGGSGFVAEVPGANNRSEFSVEILGGGMAQTATFLTDVTGLSMVSSLIFSGAAGTYQFAIDNTSTNPSAAALYDIQVSAIPLPASVLFLLSGLVGLGFVSRRKAA